MKQIIADIIAERERQISKYGYTKESDLRWENGELAKAVVVYVMPCDSRNEIYHFWPFDCHLFRPENDRKQELIKAAALIVAEIERLNRRDNVCKIF